MYMQLFKCNKWSTAKKILVVPNASIRKSLAALFLLTICVEPSFANEADEQAQSFARIYMQLCLKNISDLEVIRKKLERVPQLPAEKAVYFLANHPGSAWPVPDKHGTFVVALPSGINFCSVFARKASAEAAIKLFTKLVATAPPPLTSKLVKNEERQTAQNGMTQTLSYEWAVPNATRTLLFTLTTATSESASIQVLGSAAVIGQ